MNMLVRHMLTFQRMSRAAPLFPKGLERTRSRCVSGWRPAFLQEAGPVSSRLGHLLSSHQVVSSEANSETTGSRRLAESMSL